MKNKKLLVLSALGAALGLTTAVGATYALFSDNAKTDITVTAGQVDVSASVKNFKMYSGKWSEEANDYVDLDVTEYGKFLNAGYAMVSDGSIKLLKMSPMDRVEFDMEVKNLSDITIKFRSFIKCADQENPLLSALKITIGGMEIDNGTFYSEWTTLKENEHPGTMHVVIELPKETGNEYQGKDCELIYGVEAVQGNEKTEDWVSDVTYISSVSSLLDFAEDVNNGNHYNGKKVKLLASLDLTGVDWTPIGKAVSYPTTTFGGIFDGCGNTIKNMTATDTTTVDLASAGFFGSITGTVKNLTLENPTVKSLHYAGAVVGFSSSNGAVVDNCHVKGGSVFTEPELMTDHYDNGDKAGGLMGYMVDGDKVTNCTVEGTTVTGYRDIGGLVGASAGLIKDCAVKNAKIVQSDKNAYQDSVTTIGEVLGRNLGATLENNTSTGCSMVKGANYVGTKAELEAFRNNVNAGKTYAGKTIYLTANIDLEGANWEAIGTNVNDYPSHTFSGTFDGQGYKVSNFVCKDLTQNYSCAGFFGTTCSARIMNLTIENATIESHHFAGGIVAYTSSNCDVIENCKVINSTITSSPELLTSGYDNGDKAGGIAGYMTSGCQILNCAVEGTTIKAYRDLGGIVGYGAKNLVVKGNTVKNSFVHQCQKNGYKDSIDTYHEIVGRDEGAIQENNTFSSVEVKSVAE